MPELKLNLPKGYLSSSAIGEYLKCPYGYKLKYIDGERGLTAPEPLLLGSAGHKALEENYLFKLPSGEDRKPDAVVATFQDAMSDQLRMALQNGQKPAWETCETEVRDKGEDALRQYMKHMAPDIQPVAVEKPFEANVGGVPVKGRIDLVRKDEGHRLVDFKFAKTAKSVNDAIRSHQLGIYAIVEGMAKVEFISLPKTKVPKPVAAAATLTPEDKQRTINLVKSVAGAISAGVFPFTDPSSWACGERYCSVWHACPQGGKLQP